MMPSGSLFLDKAHLLVGCFIKVVVGCVGYQRSITWGTGSRRNKTTGSREALDIGSNDHLVTAGRADCLSDNFKEQPWNSSRIWGVLGILNCAGPHNARI